MNCTHLKLWNYMEKAQSWPSQVFGCFLCQRSFLQVILVSWEQVRMTHKLCFGDTCNCVSVLDENRSASLSIKKRFLQVPVLPQTMKIKATGLCRLYVCVHSISQMGIRIPKKSPCSTDLYNCKSLVTFYAFSFALSVSQRSCQILRKETFQQGNMDITGNELLWRHQLAFQRWQGENRWYFSKELLLYHWILLSSISNTKLGLRQKKGLRIWLCFFSS